MSAKSVPSSTHRDASRGHASRGKAQALPPVRKGYYDPATWRPEESLGLMLRRVTELLARSIDARMAEYDLTDAQWRPLLKLSLHSEVTATQLARLGECDTGATTRMLDRLEDKGLIRRVRSTHDRRVLQIELTDEGRKAAAVVPHVIADVLNAHLADLTRAEVDQLRGLLERVLAAGQRESSHEAVAAKK
jgi:DNA-binding MarR family transcriptional regulator